MGLTTTTSSSPTPTPTPATSPDTDHDTPPHNYQTIMPVSFSNGTLKKHHPYNHHHLLLHPEPPAEVVNYKECLKNHAANLGGYALDGCGEFMPSPNSNPSDPTSLKCAACNCHRNFHRPEPEPIDAPNFIDFCHPTRPSPSPSPPPPPPPPQFPKYMSFQPPQTLNNNEHFVVPNSVVTTPGTPNTVKNENLKGRKRFRSRFTPEQKLKMFAFAEKTGWRMQRCDESMVEKFCHEIGVTRCVFKVWVHNNKNTLGKREANPITITNGTTTSANGFSVGQEN